MNNNNPTTSGLVLYLNFEQIIGNKCYDQSGNNNEGTIYGATATSVFQNKTGSDETSDETSNETRDTIKP